MRKFQQIVLFLALSIFIVGCATTSKGPQTQAQDNNIPEIRSIRTVVSSSSVGLEWDSPKDSNVKGFYVYRGELNKPLERIETIKNRFSTHYLDDGLKAGTSYRYSMRTYSDSGISGEGITVTATTAQAIESVSFAQALYGLPKQVKIVWRPHTNLRVNSYIIERSKAGSKNWSRIAEVKGRLSAEYIDEKVKSGENYEYRIKVKTMDGEISAPSKNLSATTKELPSGVVNLAATTDQPKKIVLSWDSPVNEHISHYQIYISRLESLGFIPLAKTDKNFYEDFINSNGAKRYYKVTFVDKDGLESSMSENPVMGKTLDQLPAPVLSAPIINNNTIVLNWDTGARSQKYTIARSGGGRDKTIENITRNSYVDSEVVKGNKYTYRVIAVDEYGISSSKSNGVSVEF
ncbi:MAG: fibronectin type III domain-containing protein [Campylobacter sp.]|nr:fibronectin type III domain-containing protein [Campylobacter sp.]